MTNVLTEPPRPAPAALATEQEAREVAESAREKDWIKPSFVRQLFEGRIALDLIHPFPTQSAEDLARAKPFMEKLEAFLQREVDSDKIDAQYKHGVLRITLPKSPKAQPKKIEIRSGQAKSPEAGKAQ